MQSATLLLTLSSAVAAKSLGLPSGQGRQIVADNFEASCASDDDYGWPRFQSRDELAASPWAMYFREIYGDLPDTYPVCVYDLGVLDQSLIQKAGISLEPKTDPSTLKNGDIYASYPSMIIYHDTYQPAPANAWIEVTHSAFPSEKEGMWCWRTRGSGIWFNTGNTVTFPSPADPAKTHADAIAHLTEGCSVKVSAKWPRLESDVFGLCAREKGYDSIQFEPTEGAKPVGTFGLPGFTELVITNLDGQYNCGTKDAAKTTLHSGWRASQQCDCENLPIDEKCGLMPRAPFPWSLFPPHFVEPPLCEAQHKRFWQACDPTTCSNSYCKVQNASQPRLNLTVI